MKRAFLLLLAIVPTSALVADEPQPTKPATAVETHFAQDAVLTEEQINIVRQLALKAGLPAVGEITIGITSATTPITTLDLCILSKMGRGSMRILQRTLPSVAK